jgi:23S rRNA pseudouridine955/2504/2580 synthase
VTARRPLLLVSREEEGMKLARFLERRLALPAGMIRKWIRTGQTRLNGRRAGPFALLSEGDAVRLPPFALPPPPPPPPRDFVAALVRAGLCVAACTEDLLVLNKPGGLPTHPGSGHTDSLTRRLTDALPGQPFVPAPAHRLDRHTSGLILAGRTHRAQERLHRAFAERTGLDKEYLVWVAGRWEEEEPRLLADVLRRERDRDGRERMRALPGGSFPAAEEDLPEEARSLAVRVRLLPGREAASLLLVRLLTGRTHQIRVQTATRGFPVLGDGRHKGPPFPLMLLHAWRLRLSAALVRDLSASCPEAGPREYRVLPDWPPPFALVPEEAEEALARLEEFAGDLRKR